MPARSSASPRELVQHFGRVTTPLPKSAWSWLGALAAERRLGHSTLTRLGAREQELGEALQSGLLVAAGKLRPLELRLHADQEPAYAVSPALRQLVLRRSAALGVLSESVTAAAQLLGHRSVGAWARELQCGRYPSDTPDSRSSQSPRARSVHQGTANCQLNMEGELRESIVQPFDPTWFVRTWGSRSDAVATRVLVNALPALHSVGDLYTWATVTELNGPGTEQLSEALAAHAYCRADDGELRRQLAVLEPLPQLGLRAALELASNQLQRANRLLDEVAAWGGSKLPRPSAWSPPLALLMLARNDPQTDAAATRWLRARGGPPWLKRVARAMAILQDARLNPEARFKRIDPHALAADAPAWEVLVLGLTVYAFQERPSFRVSWPYVLVERGVRWLSHGYPYLARQALVLAHAMDPAEFDRACRDCGTAAHSLSNSDGLDPQPGDLCRLIHPRQPWEVSLQVLDQLTFDEDTPDTPLRLVWHVETDTARVHKPALLRYVSDQGWLTEGRISLDHAAAHYRDLPQEDQRVLDAVKGQLPAQIPTGNGVVQDHSDVLLEGMVGHPRVVDGARGGMPVEVTTGICQVETRDEGDQLWIRIEPAGLGPGLNILKEGDGRLVVVRVSPSMQRVLDVVGEGLSIPMDQAPRALEVIGKLASSIPVNSVHLGAEKLVPANARPCLRLIPAGGAWLMEAGVKPFGAGGRFFLPGTGPSVLTRADGGRRLRLERDFAEEARQLEDLLSSSSILRSLVEAPQARAPGEPDLSWSLSAERLLELLAELRQSDLTVDFDWPQSAPVTVRGTMSAVDLRGSLRTKRGWYLLSGEVSLDELTTLNLADLVRLPTRCRGRFVQLPSGAYLELEARVRRLMAALALGSRNRRGGLRVAGAYLPLLRELLEPDRFPFDDEAQLELSRSLHPEVGDAAAPPGLRAQLRPYQLEGYRWLRRLAEMELGACLADDMGLGKTVQILALLCARPVGARHLVVAPTSVCTNWLRESERFLPDLSVEEYVGGTRKRLAEQIQDGGVTQPDSSRRTQLFIVSYGVLVEDHRILSAVDWDTVVLDEAQYIKNAASARARATHTLRARVRIAATGTPIENHLGDLWSIFNFLQPGLLGTWANYRTFFLNPIERDEDHGARAVLHKLVKPFVLRRQKADVLAELPPLTVVRHEVTLSKQERLRYTLLRKRVHEKLRTAAGKRNNKLEILAEITRLRRFCCHQQLVFPDAPTDSAKLNAFMRLAEELVENGRRALVFSQYVDFLALVRERVEEMGVEYEYLDGSTPKAQRQQCIDRFQHGNAPLFLISLKAGGLGLNLTAAETVVHLDPWWNPAVKSQATDRAHRMGQKQPVTVYEFVTRNSIEEDILTLHYKKRRLAEALLKGTDSAARLTADELLHLLDDAEGGAESALATH